MIDWDRVNALKSEVGPEDFEEIIDLFFEETEDLVARLPHIREGKTLAESLHFLKSGALNMGFEAFSGLCQAGEKSAEKGQGDSIDIPRIIDVFDKSRQQFRTRIDRRL